MNDLEKEILDNTLRVLESGDDLPIKALKSELRSHIDSIMREKTDGDIIEKNRAAIEFWLNIIERFTDFNEFSLNRFIKYFDGQIPRNLRIEMGASLVHCGQIKEAVNQIEDVMRGRQNQAARNRAVRKMRSKTRLSVIAGNKTEIVKKGEAVIKG